MRILFVIDHFGSGGAQRQSVVLARGLKARGHQVEFFIYFPQHDFFREQVAASGIPIHEFPKRKGFSVKVVRQLSSLMRSGAYDVAMSYMASPNVYAELARTWAPSTTLVVSERGSHFGDRSRLGAFIRRNLHRLADHIVVNSVSHRNWLAQQFPWMAPRLSAIYNGFDLSHFAPQPNPPAAGRHLDLMAVGRVDRGKNVVNLLEALRLFHAKHGWVPRLDWVGRREEDTPAARAYSRQVDELLSSLPAIAPRWRWLGERRDVPQLLQQHHALIHPTFHEGLPNAICEALAAGRPVLASGVCDNGLLVKDGERGFVFDPSRAESIAASIERLAALSREAWIRMSNAARAYAESSLAIDRLVSDYETLFGKLIASERRHSAKESAGC